MKKSLGLLVSALLLTGCGRHGNESAFGPFPSTGTSPSASSRCVQFPTDLANELVSDPVTGTRIMDGPITGASMVKSTDHYINGNDLWFVSFKVNETLINLVTVRSPGEIPHANELGGFWVSLNDAAVQATDLPLRPGLNSASGVSLADADGAQQAVSCVGP